jgi:hypothetical protein
MMLTDHNKRLLLRGMSIANGLLFNAQCIITEYQRTLAEAWSIDDCNLVHREEFNQLVEEINEAVAAKYPDPINPGAATKSPKGN